MHKFKILYPDIYIILYGLILFIPFLGGMNLFDWDEINFAESAREMIITGNYLDVSINYLPFWEKPPLFIWMQVFSMKIFGINEFAARFPNAICGILTLLTLFHVGRKFRDEKFGWIWVLAYSGSLLPFAYFKSGIIDPWFNLFIFTGIVNFIYYLTGSQIRLRSLFLSAFFLGCAVLTKGPVALLIFGLSFLIYLFIVRFHVKTNTRDIVFFIAILTITGGFWFILQVLSGKLDIIRDFLIYQVRLFKTKDAGHGGFLGYHFVVLFFGVFPASIFALFAFFKKYRDNKGNTDFALWMQVLFFVVLVLFTVVKTKIVHYSSMAYFPLTFLASVTIWKYISGGADPGLWLRILLSIISVLLGLIVVFISLADSLKEWIISTGLIKDGFAVGNLQASGHWTGFEWMLSLIFVLISLWFIWFQRKNTLHSVAGIFVSSMLFAFFIMAMITPRIENYSQRAVIDFYRNVSSEDAYLKTLGFKSYAHLYYGQVKPPENQSAYEPGWLLTGKIDKKTYIVFKINRKVKYLKEYPDIDILFEKNGFVFAKRDPSKNNEIIIP